MQDSEKGEGEGGDGSIKGWTEEGGGRDWQIDRGTDRQIEMGGGGGTAVN